MLFQKRTKSGAAKNPIKATRGVKTIIPLNPPPPPMTTPVVLLKAAPIKTPATKPIRRDFILAFKLGQ